MARKTNNAEGGTNGTTITVANTGGSSGDAASAVFTTSTTAIFDITHARGSLAYKFVGPASGGNPAAFEWRTIGTVTELWARAYVWIAANPTNAVRPILFQTSTGVLIAAVQITTGGKVALIDSANTTLATAISALATGQWWRLEFHVTVAASGATVECGVYDADSVTIDSTRSATSSAGNTGSTAIDRVRFGNGNGAINTTLWEDDVGYDTAGALGPSNRSLVVPFTSGSLLTAAFNQGQLALPFASGSLLAVAGTTGLPLRLAFASGSLMAAALNPAQLALAFASASVMGVGFNARQMVMQFLSGSLMRAPPAAGVGIPVAFASASLLAAPVITPACKRAWNDFEGGTDGTVLTPGNTGGGGRNPADVIAAGITTNTPIFSAAAAMHGALGMRTIGRSTGTSYFEWGDAMGPADLFYLRTYVRFPALPTGPDFAFIEWRENAGARLDGQMTLTSGGKLRLYDSTGTVRKTSGVTLSVDTVYRIEALVDCRNGQLTVWVYAGDATATVDFAQSGAGFDFGIVPSAVRFGQLTHLTGFLLDFDDVAVDCSKIGPSLASLRLAFASGTLLGIYIPPPSGASAVQPRYVTKRHGIGAITHVLTGPRGGALLLPMRDFELNVLALGGYDSASGTVPLDLVMRNPQVARDGATLVSYLAESEEPLWAGTTSRFIQEDAHALLQATGWKSLLDAAVLRALFATDSLNIWSDASGDPYNSDYGDSPIAVDTSDSIKFSMPGGGATVHNGDWAAAAVRTQGQPMSRLRGHVSVDAAHPSWKLQLVSRSTPGGGDTLRYDFGDLSASFDFDVPFNPDGDDTLLLRLIYTGSTSAFAGHVRVTVTNLRLYGYATADTFTPSDVARTMFALAGIPIAADDSYPPALPLDVKAGTFESPVAIAAALADVVYGVRGVLAALGYFQTWTHRRYAMVDRQGFRGGAAAQYDRVAVPIQRTSSDDVDFVTCEAPVDLVPHRTFTLPLQQPATDDSTATQLGRIVAASLVVPRSTGTAELVEVLTDRGNLVSGHWAIGGSSLDVPDEGTLRIVTSRHGDPANSVTFDDGFSAINRIVALQALATGANE